ncbi:MAG: hypothetical protein ABFD21_05710 [Anaerolineaceae bacterium]
MAQALTLPSIFKAVSKTLSENEAALNEADTYNHNHGSNMAKAFTTVSKAVAKKKDLPVSEQLTYASKVLQDSTSSSAKIYAQGLANAAQKFQGKQLNENTVGLLIDSMMGIQEPAQAASGAAEKSLLGSLLGGLAGGQQQQQTQPSGGDLLGSLLGGQSNPDNGLDITDLLSAGLSYYSAKEQGGSTMEAIMQALASASPLGQRDDQKQSGALVINTILNMLKKKKK